LTIYHCVAGISIYRKRLTIESHIVVVCPPFIRLYIIYNIPSSGVFAGIFHLLEVYVVSFFIKFSTSFLDIGEKYIYILGASDDLSIISRSLLILQIGPSARSFRRFYLPKAETLLFSGCKIFYDLFTGRSSRLSEVSDGVGVYYLMHIILSGRYVFPPTRLAIPFFILVVSLSP